MTLKEYTKVVETYPELKARLRKAGIKLFGPTGVKPDYLHQNGKDGAVFTGQVADINRLSGWLNGNGYAGLFVKERGKITIVELGYSDTFEVHIGTSVRFPENWKPFHKVLKSGYTFWISGMRLQRLYVTRRELDKEEILEITEGHKNGSIQVPKGSELSYEETQFFALIIAYCNRFEIRVADAIERIYKDHKDLFGKL